MGIWAWDGTTEGLRLELSRICGVWVATTGGVGLSCRVYVRRMGLLESLALSSWLCALVGGRTTQVGITGVSLLRVGLLGLGLLMPGQPRVRAGLQA